LDVLEIVIMRPVFALLLTPCISLLDLSMAYSLLSPLCEHQNAAWLHAFYGVSLAANAILTFNARRVGLPVKVEAPFRYSDPALPRGFIESAAGPTGLLCTLATAAQWMAVWLMSPCLS
jgi:hypothetical protein